MLVQVPISYTTTTQVWTGSAATTTTVAPSGAAPGTVIVQTPPGYVTTTSGYAGSVTRTTTVAAPSGTARGTVVVQTPLPTLGCDPSGYLIQASTLIRVNITTGASETVKAVVWPGGVNINAIGYSVADNFLYGALSAAPFSLIRIAANGDAAAVAPLNTTLAYNCGDVDERSHYWATLDGKQWVQVDLAPGSAGFGRLIAGGTATLPAGYTVYDWAWVPGGGDALYGLAQNSARTASILMSFSRAAKTWTQLTNFGNVAGSNQWGALYATDDGGLFGSENNAGVIYRFPLPGDPATAPQFISACSKSSLNDGARCAKAAGPVKG